MEFFIQFPHGRYIDPRPRHIESDISLRQGRSLEKAGGPQKAATSFMAPIRDFLRNLFLRRENLSMDRTPSTASIPESCDSETTSAAQAVEPPLAPVVEEQEKRPASMVTTEVQKWRPEWEWIGINRDAPYMRAVTTINPASPDSMENEANVDADVTFLLGRQDGLKTRELAITPEEDGTFDEPDPIFTERSHRASAKNSDEPLADASIETSALKSDWIGVLITCSPLQQHKERRAIEFQQQLDKLVFDDLAPSPVSVATGAPVAIAEGDEPVARSSRKDRNS